ncbi:MAG: prepilin-type N-terminal cleavage/methylation domain-containing protein [Candidatus Pacebacteria bacterium]|nr:prepilin-type N-terminal cleavage/methylation domain-containing protein [Candidatus Paceibacterota bacterium]
MPFLKKALKNNKGFTIIELLVTLSILTVISGMMIVYSRGGERQLLLIKEQTEIANAITRAKSLAIQGFEVENICGYGVHFYQEPTGNGGFDISSYEDCGNFDPPSRKVYQSNTLDPRVKFTAFFSDVIFMPPDPEVSFNPQVGIDPRVIEINSTSLDFYPLQIKINGAGQISTTQ